MCRGYYNNNVINIVKYILWYESQLSFIVHIWSVLGVSDVIMFPCYVSLLVL